MSGGTIAERIRSRRKAARLSLDQLAASAGISKTYLWELEADGDSIKRPSADVLQRIASSLGLTLAGLAGEPSDGAGELPPEFAALGLSWRGMVRSRDLLRAEADSLRVQRDALLAAIRIAINTVECASIDVRTGEHLPWYRAAKRAVALVEARPAPAPPEDR